MVPWGETEPNWLNTGRISPSSKSRASKNPSKSLREFRRRENTRWMEVYINPARSHRSGNLSTPAALPPGCLDSGNAMFGSQAQLLVAIFSLDCSPIFYFQFPSLFLLYRTHIPLQRSPPPSGREKNHVFFSPLPPSRIIHNIQSNTTL